MNHRLGAAITAVSRINFPDEDWKLASYGDLTTEVARYQLREQDRVARQFGFRDITHLRAEVERRTSPRWVHFHLPF
jgi:hypothetical protein